MGAEILLTLAKATLLSSLAILGVGLLRIPLRKLAGPRAAYWIWLLVPAATLTLLLPPPAQLPLPAGVFSEISLPEMVPATLGAPASSDEWLIATLLGAWASGVVAMVIGLVIRQRVFLRSQGSLVPDERGICRSDGARAPMLVGIFRARIVVPADFEARYAPRERELILTHERAHETRRDIPVNALALLSHCVFWFNPLVYLALGWLRHDQELACDEHVLSSLPRTDLEARRIYGDALLKAQLATQASWRMPIGCHWQSTHPLKERIAMLKNPLPGATRRVAGILVVLGLSSTAGYVAWAGQTTLADGAVLVDLKVTITDSATNEFRSLATQYLVNSGEEIKSGDGQPLDYSCVPYLPDADGRTTNWGPLMERGLPKPIDDEILLACAIREGGVQVAAPVVLVNDGQPGTMETTVAGRLYRLQFVATTHHSASTQRPEDERQPEVRNRGTDQNTPPFAISADHMSMLENGDIDYSGNVVVRTTDPEPRVTVTPGAIETRAGGPTIMRGVVRFVLGDRLLKTDRAIIEKDGTIRMDSVRESHTSESR
jgi:bla regulator protein blaR1